MKCKKCGQILEENQNFCPNCGVSITAEFALEQEPVLEQKEKPAKKARKPLKKGTKITLIIVSIILSLLIVFSSTVLLILRPWKNDIDNRKVYQASDFLATLAHDAVVATMGDYQLTNGQLQVFFWMQVYDLVEYYQEQYGQYATYYLKLDLSKPLSEQMYDEKTGMTWEQYFLQDAFYAWHRYQALADAAKSEGYQLPGEYQKYFSELRSNLEKTAKTEGYGSVDALLQADLGKTVTFDDYYHYLDLYYTANLYFTSVTSKLVFTDAELEAFFTENRDSLAHYGITKDSGVLVKLRHITTKPISTKDEHGNMVVTDEAWENCRKKAQAILDKWLAGERTEESFAQLAQQKSENENTADNGGFIENLAKNDWLTVDVRHILIVPEGGSKSEDGKDIIYTDAEWAACKDKAQALLDEYLAGDRTEEAFGAMANKHSDDNGGSVTNGGLYDDVYKGEMVKEFEEWIMDPNRQSGETGLVKTKYGYHIMYFVHRDGAPNDWIFDEERKGGDYTLVKTDDSYEILFYITEEEGWKVWCRDGLMTEKTEELMQSYANERPIEKFYWAVALSALPEKSK